MKTVVSKEDLAPKIADDNVLVLELKKRRQVVYFMRWSVRPLAVFKTIYSKYWSVIEFKYETIRKENYWQ